jgi:flagellum-specific peptidoglycan hydrolase FlgJ
MRAVMFIILLTSAICSNGQTVAEVRAEIIRQGIPHAEIVLAQARLETGNFTSKLCKTKHNIFGIRQGKRYKSYPNWRECVSDYKKRISSRYKGGDYYAFLRRIGYAEDRRYVEKIKKFKN